MPRCPVVFFQAEDGIRDWSVTGVQTCALPIYAPPVIGFGVVGGLLRGSGENVLPRDRCGGEHDKKMASVDVHFAPSAWMAGLCGLWQGSPGGPPGRWVSAA